MATYTDNYNLIKPSYSEIADVAVINTNMNTIDDIMHSSQVSLAPAYDSTQTYNTGDVVMYELLMYKCTDDNVTGTWNASKWERTTASECGDSGSDVEANPTGTATEELNKLRVDNTIYSIPEGSEVVVYGEASGSIAEFDDGSNKPMSKCKIEINAVQDLHGYDSPWVGGSGKNKLNEASLEGGYTLSTATGLPTSSASSSENRIATTSPIKITGENVTVSFKSTIDTVYFMYSLFNSDTLLTRVTGKSSGTTIDCSNATDMYIAFYDVQGSDITSGVVSDVQVELGSTATSYAPYSNICPISGFNGGNVNVSPTTSAQDGTTYSVSWQSEAGTVYGGNIDLVSGVLTVDMKYDQMTYAYLSGLDSDGIGYSATATTFAANTVWVRNWHYTDYPQIISGGIKAVCNAFRVTMHNRAIFSSQYRTYFDVGSMTSVAEFLAAVQTLEANGDGLWIAHELATPLTYQLTPIQVNSLLGINNVWNDTNGETEVKYIRDLNTTINILWNAVFNQSNTRSLSLMKGVKSEDTDTKEVEEIEEKETEKEVQKEIKKEEIND